MALNKKYFLYGLVLFAIVIRVYCALIFQSRSWIDEHWVMLNPAYILLTGHGKLVGDWDVMMRSWTSPTILFGYLKTLSWLHITRGTIVIPLVKLFFAALTMAAIFLLARELSRLYSLKYPLGWGLLLVLFNPDLIHLGATGDLNVFGFIFLVLGLIFFNRGLADQKYFAKGVGWLVFSNLIRFQYVIITALSFIYLFFTRLNKKQLTKYLITFVIISLGLLLFEFGYNTYRYQRPNLPIFSYVYMDTLGGYYTMGGVTPFYHGLELLQRLVSPIGCLIILLATKLSFQKTRYLSVVSWGFLIAHSLLGHKELRYFYAPAILLLMISATALQSWFEHNGFKRSQKKLIYSALVLIFIAQSLIYGFRAIKKVPWHDYEYPARLETWVGTQEDVKGLITFGWGGIYSGSGYTFYRTLPYEFAENKSQVIARNLDFKNYNYLIAPEQQKNLCRDFIKNEGGASVYRCSTEELELVFKPGV